MENRNPCSFYQSLKVFSETALVDFYKASQAYLNIIRSICDNPYGFHEGLNMPVEAYSQLKRYLMLCGFFIFIFMIIIFILHRQEWIYSLYVIKDLLLFFAASIFCIISGKIVVGRNYNIGQVGILGCYVAGFSFVLSYLFKSPVIFYYGPIIFGKPYYFPVSGYDYQGSTLEGLDFYIVFSRVSIDAVGFVFLVVTIAMIFSWVYQNQNISKWKARWGACMAILMMTPLFILINTIF